MTEATAMDASSGVDGSPEGHGRRRRRWRRRALVLGALAGLGLVAASVLGGDDGNEPRLRRLEVTVADVEQRWAAAAAATGVEPPPALVWELDEALGAEVASYDLGPFGTVDLYRDPGGRLSGVDLLGRFATDADRARFRAEARAAVAAVLGVDDETASRIVERDLGLDGQRRETELEIEHDGVRVVATRSASTAQLRISASPR